jgi:hypothetical protein
MKNLNCLIALAAVAIGAGCRSAETHHATTTTTVRRVTVQTAPPQREVEMSGQQQNQGVIVSQGTTSNFDYQVELIPNSRLSATSREGDKSKEVYSSNIIGVYVHPHNASAGSTNVPAAPNPGENLGPE